ncbi:3-phosphoshikimate 1-carboxyvinyltransferase [Deltaproteobacteria bacterium TL4]
MQMKPLSLAPISTISGRVQLPGSKSLSNRVLLLSLLAKGKTLVKNLLDSDDIRYMVDALKKLNITFEENREEHQITIVGCGGKIPVNGAELFLGNAGTAMRPLTAAVCMGQGRFVLDGVQRMRERPIIDLVDGLQQLGVHINCVNKTGCPPVEIQAKGIPGGTTHLSGAISSQYLSAILMAAPYAKKDVDVIIKNKLVSIPYVKMTLNLMERFGISIENDDYKAFHIKGHQVYLAPGTIYVEGDASSASYFLAGAAITGGTVTVEGCGSDSIQGDSEFATILGQMGADVQWDAHSITVTGKTLKGLDVDMNTMPDAAMTLAVVALFAKGKTAIRNIYNWRVKETERLHAVSTELKKLGAIVEVGEDYLVITPPASISPASIETYDDHRMAMAFSLAACGHQTILIQDPDCVRKTFPDYFEILASLSQS